MAKANKEGVKLTGPTLIGGAWHETGDSVEVYPFQKRHLKHYGNYIEGGRFDEDVFSEGEKESGAMEVLKRQSERDFEVWSVDAVYEDNDEPGEGESSDEQASEPKPKRSRSVLGDK